MSFQIQSSPLNPEATRAAVTDPRAGGFCAFEGWVRNHHQGKEVLNLEYEAYQVLAEKEGNRIFAEAGEKFDILHASGQHRTGRVELGELAVVICVSSAHREAAFAACRYIIDEIKSRVPIWKKEFFTDGESGWVRCDHCAGEPSSNH
ncbi:MAG: molybdenum cofactor biosynthesis protein MoaE [Verrucomicrobiales bacterium]